MSFLEDMNRPVELVSEPKPKRKPRKGAAGNPWVAALHAFIDEQEVAGPDRKLSPKARAVWHHLHRHADGRNGMSVSAGIAQVSRAVGLRERATRKAVQELLAAGYLVRTVRGRKQHGASRYVVRGAPRS